jgi:acyl-CoA hydrolase
MSAILSKVIFPKYVNHHNTLFGGQALQWMDELAFIAVREKYDGDFVTVKVTSVNFLKPIFQNEIVEFEAIIVREGNVKIEVSVIGSILKSKSREKAIEGTFILARVNESMQPIRLK